MTNALAYFAHTRVKFNKLFLAVFGNKLECYLLPNDAHLSRLQIFAKIIESAIYKHPSLCQNLLIREKKRFIKCVETIKSFQRNFKFF
jgi:hypothetical protein